MDKDNKKIVIRKPLSDADKFTILQKYSQGVPVSEIAQAVSRDTEEINRLVTELLRNMNSIKETNELMNIKCSASFKKYVKTAPTRFLTSEFLSKVEERAEVYAYYYAQTGDNKFSLEQSQLDVGIAKAVPKVTKDYIMRIRGQYLRDMPEVKKYIQEEQDKRIAEYRLEKPQIQMDLVKQVEELKEIVQDDPKQRSNLLKAIEMLGRTIGAFTDRVEVEEADAKSGLQLILEKAKREASAGTYTIEDVPSTSEDVDEEAK